MLALPLRGRRRDTDHGDPSPIAVEAPDAPRRLATVDVGQVVVHEHGVVGPGRDGLKGLGAGAGGVHVVTGSGEERLHHHLGGAVVFH